jgi:hypothetical protein
MPFKCPKCGKQTFNTDQTIYEKQEIILTYDPATHTEYYMWGEPEFCETISIDRIVCADFNCRYELTADEQHELIKEIV